MYVHESGTQGAPTILFLHGGGTSGWMWQGQIASLQDFHCLNVDLPGHGKSNTQEWVSLADTADGIAEIIRTRATNGKASVVGLSLGGYVTLDLLARHHMLIERAVMSGITAAPLNFGKMMMLQLKVMSRLMKLPPMIWLQAKMLNIPSEDYAAYAEGVRAMSRQSLMKVYDEILFMEAPQSLSQVHIPTLVVAGSKELQPILEGTQTVANLMPNAEGYLIPDVHHGWNGEAPELFNRMLRAWLTGKPLPVEMQPVQNSPTLKYA